MRSCSASGAAAGAPGPPGWGHVARLNWYLPRYMPLEETACGSPPDSHWAIRSSVADGALTERVEAVELDVAPVELAVAPVELAVVAGASPRAARVCGPTMPS